MEAYNGMTDRAGMNRCSGLRGAVRHCLSWAILSVLLAACGNVSAGSGGMPERHATAPEPVERLAIVVNLAVGAGSGPIAAATARVMEEVKAAMPAEDLATVRTFGSLPVLALSADGALIARLLALPEVESIEQDRELAPLGIAPAKPGPQ